MVNVRLKVFFVRYRLLDPLKSYIGCDANGLLPDSHSHTSQAMLNDFSVLQNGCLNQSIPAERADHQA